MAGPPVTAARAMLATPALLPHHWRMSDGRFRIVAVATAIAGTTLGNGIAHGWLPLIVAGAVMSAVFPWAIVIAWLILRWRTRRHRCAVTDT